MRPRGARYLRRIPRRRPAGPGPAIPVRPAALASRRARGSGWRQPGDRGGQHVTLPVSPQQSISLVRPVSKRSKRATHGRPTGGAERGAWNRGAASPLAFSVIARARQRPWRSRSGVVDCFVAALPRNDGARRRAARDVRADRRGALKEARPFAYAAWTGRSAALPLGFRDGLPGRIRRPEDLQVVGLGLGHRREREIAVVGGRGIGVDPPAIDGTARQREQDRGRGQDHGRSPARTLRRVSSPRRMPWRPRSRAATCRPRP